LQYRHFKPELDLIAGIGLVRVSPRLIEAVR
jgi:hypothetical protein